ncbi:MAG: hypothetical protein AVDCRST_MAG76-3035 [uncultured Acidimicrobiales bacterium]|uniref:Type II secretion system protein GspF domain-containing protein n=1 Tax=uncultured Acidimicrobiales bacterium TaxID=310071 RepID=A0A6J4J3K8_9ACTN|nr:MAG: hypothetical protein AVDCRST_MAG76-3035 [uncultured Acidimicrobiales bacterium]
MTATLMALAWAAAVAVAAAAPLARRAEADRAGEASRHRMMAASACRSLLNALGAGADRSAARALGRAVPVTADPGALGAGLVLGAATALVLPGAWPLGLLFGSMPSLLSRAGRGRARAAAGRAILDELPEVIDLLGLGVAAGLTAPLAVAAVGRRGSGPLAAALGAAAVTAARHGRRLPDVLDDVASTLGTAGDAARPLLAALADAARHGTALGPGLDRLATEARTARRHRAEERARRVPILLLFPLVTCTLPALGLLTIAPLAVGALQDLRA